LQTSSNTHVPTIPLLIRVGTIVLVHRVGTRRTQRELHFGVAFLWKNWMIYFPRRQKLTFYEPFPIQAVRGTIYTHVHFLVTQRKLAIFINVRVQIDYIHIANFFPPD
jgi:hypothetical protein